MSDQNAITVQSTGFIAPAVDVATAAMRYNDVRSFIKTLMVSGTHYGTVPGANKPCLFKAGAEMMTSFFGFTVRFSVVEKIEDWTGENHGGEPFFYYSYRCQLWRGETLVAEGDGSCNSWESKYRYRQGQRVCPKCGKPTIFKSKDGNGWYCWRKKDGCGATFTNGDTTITGQEVGKVKNPDIADVVNTIQKMAQKRALIAPVLIATNTSDYFTQDLEDFAAAPAEYVEGDYREAPAAPEPPHNEQPAAPKAPQYHDGTIVAPGAMKAYEAYLAAHNGAAPKNFFNLKAWAEKVKKEQVAPAEQPAEQPAKQPAEQPAAPAEYEDSGTPF